jgi:ribosome biogenesis protein MAK21
MLQKGTLSDRVSALSLIIQRDPEVTHNYLQTLLNIAGNKSRQKAQQSITALKDVFTQYILSPENAKVHNL